MRKALAKYIAAIAAAFLAVSLLATGSDTAISRAGPDDLVPRTLCR
ncbi:MAG TPA: hypothetical protein VEF72_15625 [Mycobacterium sp.]|nr:hypothetical protein [Mycobacterium sp.]